MIENVAGPVGEALIMTAFGLVVAIPAVLGYNILGRMQRQVSEELDGFAHDLHAYVCAPDPAGKDMSVGAVAPERLGSDTPGGAQAPTQQASSARRARA
jgi:biopolymer transport protein ExbB